MTAEEGPSGTGAPAPLSAGDFALEGRILQLAREEGRLRQELAEFKKRVAIRSAVQEKEDIIAARVAQRTARAAPPPETAPEPVVQQQQQVQLTMGVEELVSMMADHLRSSFELQPRPAAPATEAARTPSSIATAAPVAAASTHADAAPTPTGLTVDRPREVLVSGSLSASVVQTAPGSDSSSSSSGRVEATFHQSSPASAAGVDQGLSSRAGRATSSVSSPPGPLPAADPAPQSSPLHSRQDISAVPSVGEASGFHDETLDLPSILLPSGTEAPLSPVPAGRSGAGGPAAASPRVPSLLSGSPRNRAAAGADMVLSPTAARAGSSGSSRPLSAEALFSPRSIGHSGSPQPQGMSSILSPKAGVTPSRTFSPPGHAEAPQTASAAVAQFLDSPAPSAAAAAAATQLAGSSPGRELGSGPSAGELEDLRLAEDNLRLVHQAEEAAAAAQAHEDFGGYDAGLDDLDGDFEVAGFGAYDAGSGDFDVKQESSGGSVF